MNDIFSVVSVDVLALTYDPTEHRLMLALHRRDRDPFAGRLALPGVVLHSGERLDDGARRACAKVTATAPLALGQLRTFDEPSRDPRGPSLSIAMWATFRHESLEQARQAVLVPTDAVPGLPFDHDHIVTECVPLLADRLWRDLTFTRTLLPEEFRAADALSVQKALTGVEPHRANLNRTLDSLPGLRRIGTVGAGAGRPSQVRTFRP